MNLRASSRNLRYLILIIFVGISALVTVGGYFYYDYRKEILREEKLNDLKAIADLKEAQILSWKTERMDDARTIIFNPFTRKNFHKIFFSSDKDFLPVVSQFLQTAKKDFKYHAIYLFSEKGQVISSSDPADMIPAEIIQKYLEISRQSKDILFSGFKLANDTLPLVDLIVPAIVNDIYGGFALFKIDPEQYLFPLIQLWPTPSESSETLIFSVQGDEIIFRNELRHQAQSSFRLKIPLTEKKVASVMAVDGVTGFVEAEDYRGKAIIAYLKKIPGTDWYLVAKTDQDEIFEPMKHESILIIVAIIGLLGFIGFISYLIFRQYLTSFFLQTVSRELGVKSAEDIAQRKRFEQQINKLNRLYSTLLSINQVIVRASEKEKILQELCTILIEKGGYRMVSIGQFTAEKLDVVASAGHVDGYYDQIKISNDDSSLGSGPSSVAIKTKKYVVCQDIENDPEMAPWKDQALSRGYRSSAAFPIISQNEAIGILNIYSGIVAWFDQEETDLLEQLANDIGYALGFFFIEEKSKATTKELEASEKKFQQVFKSMNDGIAIHELVFDEELNPVDYKLIDVNPIFEAITSIPYKKAVGSLASKLYGIVPPPYFDIYKEVAISGKSAIFEAYFAPMAKHLRVSAFSQQKNGFTTVFQDITDQVEAREFLKTMNVGLEKRVKERTALLEKANKELESFAYTVSHDLKAPLRSISSFSHILNSRYGESLDKEGKHFLQNIIMAGKNMNALIEDLLRYSQLGQDSPEMSPTDLKSVCELCLSDLNASIGSAHAAITMPDTELLVQANAVLLNQVLANLILNAITYQPPGQRPEIDISWEEDGEFVMVSVRDNGIGIQENYFQRVFKIFQRLHREDEYRGTGIGLAIVKKALEIQGGDIWISASEKGVGSTFTFKLHKSEKYD